MGPLRADRRQIFVASFSAAEDQLSQWRAYSAGSSGVSISFDLTLVRPQAATHTDLVFAPCVYDDKQKMALLENAFSHIDVTIAQWAEAFDEAVRKDPDLIKKLKTPSDIDRHIRAPGLAERLQTAVGKVTFDLVRICPLLKHSKFSEEMEWRLVLPGSMTKQVQRPFAEFRPVRDTLIPYMAFPLPKREDCTIPMNDLIVGPGSHSEVEAAMSSFLTSCDLRVIPRKSDVPYRPW